MHNNTPLIQKKTCQSNHLQCSKVGHTFATCYIPCLLVKVIPLEKFKWTYKFHLLANDSFNLLWEVLHCIQYIMFFLLIWNDNHFIHMWMIFLHSSSQIPWQFFNFVSIIYSDVLIRLLISCEKENNVFFPLVKILHNDSFVGINIEFIRKCFAIFFMQKWSFFILVTHAK